MARKPKNSNDSEDEIVVTSDQASGGDSKGDTLLPMLAAGLFLILIGAVVVMLFV